MIHKLRSATALMVVMSCISATASAGDLNPPAGPVAPTMKTIQQAEPRTPINTLSGNANALHLIASPGSYYLTGDVQGQAAKHGILVTASDVTIDLNGFTLRGITGSLDGIVGSNTNTNVTIVNGTIAEWGGAAVGSQINAAVIERVTARGNGNGILIRNGGRVSDSRALNNTGFGIVVGNRGALAINCVAQSNGGDGFILADGSTMINCTTSYNGGHGISTLNTHQLITGCLSEQNTGYGINASAGVTVERSTISANTAGGIRLSFRNRIVENNIVSNGGAGISCGPVTPAGGNYIQGNNIASNAVAIDLSSNAGNQVFRNVLRSNANNTIINGAASSAPTSTDPATAGPWANIVSP